jgi:hypothetical protein
MLKQFLDSKAGNPKQDSTKRGNEARWLVSIAEKLT